jgi:acyl carrier protein
VREQIKQIMADILDLDPDTIDESTTKDNTENWDSLSQIHLFVALEQEFNVSLEPAEIESMLSFTDIITIITDKLRSKELFSATHR